MEPLNLPTYFFRIKEDRGKKYIFDEIRRRYVLLTPEEWVRQHFVQYLINQGRYPPGLIGIEMMFRYNTMKKRVDILVHDRKGQPVMIVECKSPDIGISDFYEDEVYDQVGGYNLGYKVPYAIVTNGINNYAFKFNAEKKQYEHILEIPLFEDLLT